MTLPLSLLTGIAGAAIGWTAAAALTIFLGGTLGISDFEGGRGMLAVWGIGPIGGLVGLIAGIVLVLRKRGGHSAGGLAWRVPAAPRHGSGAGSAAGEFGYFIVFSSAGVSESTCPVNWSFHSR